MSNSRYIKRLALSVIIIQLLGFALLLVYQQRLFQAHSNATHQQTAQQQTILLSELLAVRMNSRTGSQQAPLLAILAFLQDHPTLRYAAVFNTDRQLLAALGEPPLLAEGSLPDLTPRRTITDELLALQQPIVANGQLLGMLHTGYVQQRVWTWDLLLPHLFIMIGSLLLSLLAIALFSKSARHGIKLLQEGIDAVRHDQWQHRVVPKGVLDDLLETFNELTAHLQQKQKESATQHERLLQNWQRLNTLLSGTNAVVWEVDSATGCFQYVSEQAERLLGYPTERWLDPDFCTHYVHPKDLDWVHSFLTHPAIATNNTSLDFRMFNSDEECRWLRIIGALVTESQNSRMAGLLLDVTQEKRSEQRITYLVNHDPLTGLINRHRFQERLEEQIAYNRRYQASGALLFLDLDQFKYINDTYGHHVGDEYLRQIADHLRRRVRETDVLGRLSGDEFGIILPNTQAKQAIDFADHLLKTLHTQEFMHEGRSTSFSASIGIVLFPEHGDQPSDLLAKADTAMYKAKDLGRNTYALFGDGSQINYMQDKIRWEERIRWALKKRGLQLYFQPIVDMQNGAIRHYESLLRMKRGRGETIDPGAFIGIAERFGLIREIDEWVVNAALRTQGEHISNGQPLSLTVNLSGLHFGNPQILEVIQEATERFAADPKNIVFEVTETAAVGNFTNAREFIQALRKNGYRIALDDFGSGFSSFDYLRNIPVDFIKIDGSFVRNLHRSHTDRIFVKAIVDLAQGLNITTVAEFVENRETVDILLELGVTLGQGYFFAKPAPHIQSLDELPALLMNSTMSASQSTASAAGPFPHPDRS